MTQQTNTDMVWESGPIVVGTDGSDCSSTALAPAAAQATLAGHELVATTRAHCPS